MLPVFRVDVMHIQFDWTPKIPVNGDFDLIGVIRILRMYANDLENIQNAQFGGLDEQNDIQLIIEQRLVVESSHYSKSQILA